MHHVIYLPQHDTANVAHLGEVGLADHAPGAQMTALGVEQQVIAGEHAGGLLITWGSSKPKLKDLPALTWLPAMPLDDLPARRYFVGVDPDHPPQPHELLREKPHRGTPVGMGDGHLWVIPHANELPFDIVRDLSTGEIRQTPRPAFYRFWCKALSWQQMFDRHQEGDPLPDLLEQVEFVEESLRLNYRLTPEIVTHLALMNTGPTGTLRACLAACLHVEPGGA
jgi:hypothetical protein